MFLASNNLSFQSFQTNNEIDFYFSNKLRRRLYNPPFTEFFKRKIFNID